MKEFDFVEYWANYIRKNPDSWKEMHTRFVDGQILMANEALNKLRLTEEGKKKLIELRGIKNKQIISTL